MTDFADSTVATTTSYTALLQSLRDRNKAVAQALDGSHTNLPNGAVRWNNAQSRWEKYDGSSWNPLASLFNMNVSRLQGFQTSTGATANTIALRDAAGRLKAAAPSAATDVVRKAELDAFTQRRDNPLEVTKVQVGLGSVSNDQQLVRASNLSDLPSASTARDNLGLGTAATRDAGTSNGNLVLYEDIPQPGNASTSQAGLTEYATTAEHQNGVSNRSATPAGVRQMGFSSDDDLMGGGGQDWYDVKSSRSPGTNYYNGTGRPIQVFVSNSSNNAECIVHMGRSISSMQSLGFPSGNNGKFFMMTVPPRFYYRVSGSIFDWKEMR